MPDDTDLLNSVMINGASRSILSLSHEQTRGKWTAGALFVRQLTDGSGDINDGQDAERRQRAAGCAGVNVGGEASAVVARTAAILSSKKHCRSCASIVADSGARPRPISTSTDCHS